MESTQEYIDLVLYFTHRPNPDTYEGEIHWEETYDQVPESLYDDVINQLNQQGFALWEHGSANNQLYHPRLELLVEVDSQANNSEPNNVSALEIISKMHRQYHQRLAGKVGVAI